MRIKMVLLALALSAACCGLCACGDNGGADSSSSSSTTTSASASTSTAADSSSSSVAESSATESGSDAPIAADELVGTWEMVAMSDGTDVLTLDSVDEETRASVEMKIEFNADGSMVFHNMGTDMKGTWKAVSSENVQLDFEDTAEFTDISYTATLDDGTLAIEDASLVIMFERK